MLTKPLFYITMQLAYLLKKVRPDLLKKTKNGVELIEKNNFKNKNKRKKKWNDCFPFNRHDALLFSAKCKLLYGKEC